MTHREHDIHAAKLVDLPMIHRLAEQGEILDSELRCTREISGSQSVLLNHILPQRSLYTLVGRVDRANVVGQFRLRADAPLAQIVYLAPEVDESVTRGDTPHLHLIDAMAAEAGKRGAHMLIAEVDEDSPLFITLRNAGFAVYARQEIWQRVDAPIGGITPAPLSVQTDADAGAVHSLYCAIVPRLVQPVAVPVEEADTLVYRVGERVEGFVAMSEGKTGVYLVPYLHPDVLHRDATRVLAGALEHTSRAKRPVYVCVRRYQDWLEEALTDLGFAPVRGQALMVRHIAAGIRQPAFAWAKPALEVIPVVPVRPPSTSTEIMQG